MNNFYIHKSCINSHIISDDFRVLIPRGKDVKEFGVPSAKKNTKQTTQASAQAKNETNGDVIKNDHDKDTKNCGAK